MVNHFHDDTQYKFGTVRSDLVQLLQQITNYLVINS